MQVKCASFDLKASDDSKNACVVHFDMVIFSSKAPETYVILLEIRVHLVEMVLCWIVYADSFHVFVSL